MIVPWRDGAAPSAVGSSAAVGKGYYHVVNIRTPQEVDETIAEWLTESYLAG